MFWGKRGKPCNRCHTGREKPGVETFLPSEAFRKIEKVLFVAHGTGKKNYQTGETFKGKTKPGES